MRWSFRLAVIIFLSLAPVLAQPSLTNPATDTRIYLPGDFVHVVVSAPADTSQITAIMPDGTPVTLIQERRTNVWRGVWQVPLDYKKGTYSASLTAVDVQGNVFTGETDTFTIGELSLITLVGKPSREAAAKAPRRVLTELITAEPAPANAPGQEELLSLIKRIVTPPAAKPVPVMTSATKDLLVAKNMAAGKEDLRQGKYSEAAAFFRVVLFLAPDKKEAGSLLAQAQNELAKIQQSQAEEQKKAAEASLEAQKAAALVQQRQAEASRRMYLMIAAAAFVPLVLLFWLIRRLAAGPRKKLAPKPLSDKEKQENWLKKIGWKSNPFTAGLIGKLFFGGGRINLAGIQNLIKVRVGEAGGKGIEPFTESALEKIGELSGGNPVTAMKICSWAVDHAMHYGLFSITAEVVRQYDAGSPRKVLIADDEEFVRSGLDTILRLGGGYETDFASDGVEAVEKVKANAYQAVLLDLGMPKLDGYQVLKQIREKYPDLPVVFVTGQGNPKETLESLAKYNLTGYIEKPFTPEKVLDVVARVTKK